MIRSARFWIMMTAFQVVFGLTIFTLTRQYYIDNSDNVSEPTAQDAALVSRQADEAFTNKQYDRAAELYEQLLALNPNNATAYNNLGITLHYLGRSAEALRKLNEGVTVDPTYQRLWLTLGFVNGQLGNTEQARIALTSAVQMDADNEVGQSALKMLEDLPVDTLPLADSH